MSFSLLLSLINLSTSLDSNNFLSLSLGYKILNYREFHLIKLLRLCKQFIFSISTPPFNIFKNFIQEFLHFYAFQTWNIAKFNHCHILQKPSPYKTSSNPQVSSPKAWRITAKHCFCFYIPYHYHVLHYSSSHFATPLLIDLLITPAYMHIRS